MTLAPLNTSHRQGIARILLRFRVNTLSPFKSDCETPINRIQYIRLSRECCLLVLSCVLIALARIRSWRRGAVIARGPFELELRIFSVKLSTCNDISRTYRNIGPTFALSLGATLSVNSELFSCHFRRPL